MDLMCENVQTLNLPVYTFNIKKKKIILVVVLNGNMGFKKYVLILSSNSMLYCT